MSSRLMPSDPRSGWKVRSSEALWEAVGGGRVETGFQSLILVIGFKIDHTVVARTGTHHRATNLTFSDSFIKWNGTRIVIFWFSSYLSR